MSHFPVKDALMRSRLEETAEVRRPHPAVLSPSSLQHSTRPPLHTPVSRDPAPSLRDASTHPLHEIRSMSLSSIKCFWYPSREARDDRNVGSQYTTHLLYHSSRTITPHGSDWQHATRDRTRSTLGVRMIPCRCGVGCRRSSQLMEPDNDSRALASQPRAGTTAGERLARRLTARGVGVGGTVG